MRLAVDQGHPDVDDRVAGRDARAPSGRGRPSPRDGMNCRGTAPPTTLSTNSKPAPAAAARPRCRRRRTGRARRTASRAGRDPGRAAERLAQRHPQRHRVDLRRRSGAQPVEQHVGVRLAHAPQHQLVGLGVVLQPQRRVLGDQPLQALRQLVLVGLARAPRWRPAAAGRASPTARTSSGSSLADSVSPVSARASLATAHDVAGDACGDRALGLAERRRTARRPARRRRGPRARGRPVPCPETCTGHVGAQGAGEDPHQARSGRRRGRSWSSRPRRPAARPGRRSAARAACRPGGSPAGSACSSGRREARRDDLEQLGRCRDRSARRTRQHRDRRMPRATAVSRSSIRTSTSIVLAAEVAVHQGLVLGLRDDPLDQRVAGALDQRQVLRRPGRAARGCRRE